MKKENCTISHVTVGRENNTPMVYILFKNEDSSIVGAGYNILDEHDQILLKSLQELCHANNIKSCINKKVSIIYDSNGRTPVAIGNTFKNRFYRLKGETHAFKAEEIMSLKEGTIINFSKKSAPLGAGKQAVAI